MKKWFKMLQKKCNMVNLMNLCALGILIGSINTACAWVHHQPEVPEEAKRFRRF